MSIRRVAAVVCAACLLASCSRETPAASQEKSPGPGAPAAPASAAAPAGTRAYLLERVDEAAVVQLYADGFASLPLKEKTLVWHLYQAALAGRDIYYDQRSEHALAMRRTLEAVLGRPAGVDAATLAEIQRYTKLFWLNSGPY